MKIETKFSPGDVVWKISNEKKTIFITCSFCDGSGKIEGKNGKHMMCSECHGTGGHREWKDCGWILSQNYPTLTIGEVRFKFTGEWDGCSALWSNYGPQSEKYEEKYMCRETGIGSGTLHNANHLFHTKEDAEAECERLNQ
jgi:RecJ-like exonuclease